MTIKTIKHRVAETPFTFVTQLYFTASMTNAFRVELRDLDGIIIGGIYMYPDADVFYRSLD